MRNKQWYSSNKPLIVFALAVLGVLLLFLALGEFRLNTIETSLTSTKVIMICIGVLLIIPFLYYIITSGNKKEKLKGNKKKDRQDLISPRGRKQKKTKKAFDIYIRNETTDSLIVNRKSILDNDQWHIFELKFDEALYFSNGIIIEIESSEFLEIDDFRNQVIGIPIDEYRSYDIPDYVDFALIISKPNMNNQEE